jgi:hypothetical protein
MGMGIDDHHDSPLLPLSAGPIMRAAGEQIPDLRA